MPRAFLPLLCSAILFSLHLGAQDKKAGPVIKNSGAVWNLDQLDFPTNTDKTYKAVFDIMNSPENPDKLNPSIETVARFLNMHTQQGVPVSNLNAAMVVHNIASKDLLQDEYYLQRYGVSNPNTQMINELMEAGVSVIFCGQSSIARNIPREQTIKGVETALSAMTALISLQDEGYRLIKF
jgi:intracellular sulfur oxidation DsrE/DsrF family protein